MMNRSKIYALGLLLYQVGLQDEVEAAEVIEMGARIKAHGITPQDLDKVVMARYAIPTSKYEQAKETVKGWWGRD